MKKKNLKTLVIDNTGQAINVITWEDAICLVFLEKAHVFYFHEDEYARSAGGDKFKIPSVLQVRNKSNKNRMLSLSKNNIFKRDNYKCAYCNDVFSRKELTIDHIHPLSKGGDKKTWDNLITACSTCNGKKANHLLEDLNMSLKFKPFKPKWSPKLGLSIGFDYPQEWNDWIF